MDDLVKKISLYLISEFSIKDKKNIKISDKITDVKKIVYPDKDLYIDNENNIYTIVKNKMNLKIGKKIGKLIENKIDLNF